MVLQPPLGGVDSLREGMFWPLDQVPGSPETVPRQVRVIRPGPPPLSIWKEHPLAQASRKHLGAETTPQQPEGWKGWEGISALGLNFWCL